MFGCCKTENSLEFISRDGKLKIINCADHGSGNVFVNMTLDLDKNRKLFVRIFDVSIRRQNKLKFSQTLFFKYKNKI